MINDALIKTQSLLTCSKEPVRGLWSSCEWELLSLCLRAGGRTSSPGTSSLLSVKLCVSALEEEEEEEEEEEPTVLNQLRWNSVDLVTPASPTTGHCLCTGTSRTRTGWETKKKEKKKKNESYEKKTHTHTHTHTHKKNTPLTLRCSQLFTFTFCFAIWGLLESTWSAKSGPALQCECACVSCSLAVCVNGIHCINSTSFVVQNVMHAHNYKHTHPSDLKARCAFL